MITSRIVVTTLCLGALILAACGDDVESDEVTAEADVADADAGESTSDGDGHDLDAAESTRETAPVPPGETEMTDPPDEVVNSAMVETAIADLRSRLGDPDAEIDVVSVEEVEWPDASLGCPQPGMVYAQVIVNGSRMVLFHEGVRYHYHQGGGGEPFYCAPGTAVDK